MILNIIGEHKTGKTTLSILLAKALEKEEKQVCVVYLDKNCPKSYVCKNHLKYTYSIGYLLTKEKPASRTDIFKAMIPFSSNIAIISFVFGDFINKFPDLKEERFIEFLEILRNMVDEIIIVSDNDFNLLSTKISYKMADIVLKVYEAKESLLSFEETYKNIIFNNSEYDQSKEKVLFNKVKEFENVIKYATALRKTDYFSLPYISQIEENSDNFENEIKYRLHDEKKFLREFNRILWYLYKIDTTEVEIKEPEESDKNENDSKPEKKKKIGFSLFKRKQKNEEEADLSVVKNKKLEDDF
ncbi:MAG: hypothetical protein IJ593_05720 [Lachnospiraceae bacterium]|nr:hypothetical protein [Lachnospiraceae bacterium]